MEEWAGSTLYVSNPSAVVPKSTATAPAGNIRATLIANVFSSKCAVASIVLSVLPRNSMVRSLTRLSPQIKHQNAAAGWRSAGMR
jgi:hypothetical protein